MRSRKTFEELLTVICPAEGRLLTRMLVPVDVAVQILFCKYSFCLRLEV